MTSELIEIQQIQASHSPLGEGTTSSIVKPQQVGYYHYAEQPDSLRATTGSFYSESFLALKDPVIDQYFILAPEARPSIRRKTAARIRSFQAVFTVLDWSLRGDVTDAYDAAVDLLAECNDILIRSLQYLYLEYPKVNKGANQIDLDTKLDVLISGLARASKPSAEARLKVVIQLAASKSRIVKVAVIEAAAMLVNRRTGKSVKALLNWFASDKEADSYIRHCARNALDDLVQRE